MPKRRNSQSLWDKKVNAEILRLHHSSVPSGNFVPDGLSETKGDFVPQVKAKQVKHKVL